jgi:polyhydroxybutyrate depolymerase
MVVLTLLLTPSLGPGDHERSVLSEGISRHYEIHVPPAAAPGKALPVVVALHPMGGNSQMLIQMTDLNAKSDRAGFIAVYPEGQGRGGAASGWSLLPPQEGEIVVDDVKFIDKMLDDLAGVTDVNPRRVYVVGFSAGGIMAYRLASELSDRFAAVASVAGPMPTLDIRASRPVPVIHFHGTKDTMVPYGGPNQTTPKFMKFRSVEETVQAWAKFDGCPEAPTKAPVSHGAADGLSITRTTYGPGKSDSEVVLYTIEGAGHVWPGRRPPVKTMGTSPLDLNANDLIWEFFRKHPMK